MFVGQYRHSIDAKGRLAIPARHREQLPSGSHVTVAPDGCLRIYPPAEWEALTVELRVSAATDPIERNLIRKLFADAHEIEFDKQGRVLIPAPLRAGAGLSNSAVVAGANNVVEVWSEDRWDSLHTEGDVTVLADQYAERHRGSSSNP
jgi:MraZ protein